MARPIILNTLKTGITRLREKGGASPQALYDLVNGYIDQSGSPVSRFGTTVDHTLPPGTVGLCAFQGKLHVFATQVIDPLDANYVVDVLVHPVPGFAGSIVAIHFAKPFLGFLYVVAEFSDGSVYHYWLQSPPAWAPDTIYAIDATIQPTVPNGLMYEAETPVNVPVWQPNTVYAIGAQVQPSTPNGYIYTITSTAGANAASGSTEPDWPAQDGAQVFEETDSTSVPSSGQNTTTQTTTIPPVVFDRYGNSIQVNNA
jgi:hypothetical protein